MNNKDDVAIGDPMPLPSGKPTTFAGKEGFDAYTADIEAQRAAHHREVAAATARELARMKLSLVPMPVAAPSSQPTLTASEIEVARALGNDPVKVAAFRNAKRRG